jgi:hypothetical protein
MLKFLRVVYSYCTVFINRMEELSSRCARDGQKTLAKSHNDALARAFGRTENRLVATKTVGD